MTTLRRVASAVALAVAMATLGVTAPSASAAATYSAPLSTAVAQLVVAPESTTPYDREAQFGGDWTDADGDCQNTRHEVLVAESTVAPILSSSGCIVLSGRWTPSYDGGTYTLASELQIDHLVPVSEAWDSGAQAWTQQQRVAFYNDLGYANSLVASSGPQIAQAASSTWRPRNSAPRPRHPSRPSHRPTAR